jgi:hypothetical protein
MSERSERIGVVSVCAKRGPSGARVALSERSEGAAQRGAR